MRVKYQLIILSPQNIAKKVPVTKNGPKGTSLFRVFLPDIINPTPIIAPLEKAKNKANKIFGKPRNKPIKKANFTSPRPIHLPRENKIIARKKALTIKAASKLFTMEYEL